MDIMAALLLLVIFLTAMGTKMLQLVIMLKLVEMAIMLALLRDGMMGKAMSLSALIPSLMLVLA